MRSLYNYSRDSFTEYFTDLGFTKYRAVQMMESLYRQNVSKIEEITVFKKELREKLETEFYLPTLKLANYQESLDGTRKFLFELEDGILIETVLMKQAYGYSICITTQAGCNMGCSFCASGLIKKQRNLTTSEMVLQVHQVNKLLLEEGKRVSHIVIMGIGEPFDNYENVIEFLKIVNDPKGLEIGSRHITLSTCGIVPKIYEFSSFPLQVNLAISLHFPNNELRSKHMPINKKYPLEDLLKAVDYYYEQTNRRVTFEYILIENVNDSIDLAKELVLIAKSRNVYINLIPYNNTNLFTRPKAEKMDKFYKYLIKAGVNATLRKEYGHDIDAACGQLVLRRQNDRLSN